MPAFHAAAGRYPLMAGVGSRLQVSLRLRGQSIRSLHRALKAEGVRGGKAYASVHAYASDELDPPLEFVEAAARFLDVSPGWLAFAEPVFSDEGFRASLQEAEEACRRLGQTLADLGARP